MKFYINFLIVLIIFNGSDLKAQPWRRASTEAAQHALQVLRQQGALLKGRVEELGTRAYERADIFRRKTLQQIFPLQRWLQLRRERILQLRQPVKQPTLQMDHFSTISRSYKVADSLKKDFVAVPKIKFSEKYKDSPIMSVLMEARSGILRKRMLEQQEKDIELFKAFSVFDKELNN